MASRIQRLTRGTAVLLTISPLIANADVVGVWNGHFQESPSTIVKTNPVRGKVPAIEIRADHTWHQKIGTPGRFKVTTGRWKIEKSKFTLWTTVSDGKPIKDQSPRVLTLSVDQKTMTMTVTAPVSRAQPKPLKFTITYRKAS